MRYGKCQSSANIFFAKLKLNKDNFTISKKHLFCCQVALLLLYHYNVHKYVLHIKKFVYMH